MIKLINFLIIIFSLHLNQCTCEVLDLNRHCVMDYYDYYELICRDINLKKYNDDVELYHGQADRVVKLRMENSIIPTFPRNIFNTFNNLRTVNFSNVHLTSLYSENDECTNSLPFNKSEHLVILDLSNNFIDKIKPNAFRYNYYLQQIHLENNTIEELKRHTFSDVRSLKYLYLSYNEIEKIEEYCFKNDMIQGINLQNNQLTVIKNTTFEGAKNLHWLDLKNNLIQSIEENSFIDQNLLHEISLENNQLQIIQLDTFNGLNSVLKLNLSGNLITSIEPYAFKGLTSLEYLYLMNNRLTELNEHTFGDMKRLLELYLNDNRIEYIEKNCFQNEHLRKIDLRNNKLQIIKSTTFYNVKAVRWIDLSDNEIAYIEPDAFVINTELSSLYLRNNLLTTFNDTFIGYNAKYGHALDLSSNPIETIEFHRYHHLSILNLASCSIKNLDYDTFKGLALVDQLILSNNSLEKFDMHVLYPIKYNISKLFLNKNNLKEIDYEDMKLKVKAIDITHNLWNCSFLTQMIKYFNKNNIIYTTDIKPNTARNFAGIGCYESDNPVDNIVKENNFNTTIFEIYMNKILKVLGDISNTINDKFDKSTSSYNYSNDW